MKVGAVVLALALCPAAAWAEDGRAIEAGIGLTDAEHTDEEGSAYNVGWNEPLGRTGTWSGHVRMERLMDLGGSDGLDAYQADVDLLANWGLGRRFQAYLGGGLGSVWQDATETTVEVTSPADLAALHAYEEEDGDITVNLQDEDAYLRWSAVGGIRVWLDAERRFGLGLAYRRSEPLGSEPDDSMRDQDQVSLVLSLPAGTNP